MGLSEEELFLVRERSNKDTSRFNIENLSGSGGTVSFSSVSYDKHLLSLYVGNLSGNLHFHINISATGNSSDYLSIGNSEDNHTISITDSGVEITGLLLQKSGIVTEINLITDKSKKERANFTLTNYSGKKVSAVDGGTYMYSLYKRERRADSSDDSTIWYCGMAVGKPNSSSIRFPCMNEREKFLPFLSTYTGEESLRNFSYSQGQDSALSLLFSTGAERPKQKTRKRPPRHLREQPPPVLFQKKIKLLRWSV
ncbi:pertactin-like passenger domain-containing protein [Bartonella sp. B39]